ncbi:MAG: hypothetical protein QNJ98_11695 [Planctomycetota bacterium]|nr:hypothetical protein [Planctomycetota bacterium]
MESTGSPPRRTLLIGAIVVLAAGAGFGIFKAVSSGEGDDEKSRGLGDYSATDLSKVYFGNAGLIRRPATVTVERVYAHIPEYQQIQAKGLTDKNPKYYFLIQKTSERFSQAVKAAARAGRYDFVSETGTIRIEDDDADPPTDLTQAVIDQLK